MTRARLIRARHASVCPACEETIDEDDLIAFDEEDEVWVCEDCSGG